MAEYNTLVGAVCGSVAILGSAALGVTIMTNTYAAQTNFNKQQCKMVDRSVKAVNRSVKALAIKEASSVSCVCPSASSDSVLDKTLRPSGAASTDDCYIQTPQKVTNFNLPTTGPGPGPGPPGPGVGPGTGAGPGPGPGRPFGDNGWGNGGDGLNPGSFHGGGTSGGGPGAGETQVGSKSRDTGTQGKFSER
jgi:uncharacterized membrane protein YgcG